MCKDRLITILNRNSFKNRVFYWSKKVLSEIMELFYTIPFFKGTYVVELLNTELAKKSLRLYNIYMKGVLVMDIEIREYYDQDYNELVEMVNSLYREDPVGQPMKISKVEATISEYKKHPEKLRIVILLQDNKIIGYSILVYFWSNEYGGNILIIDELYIKEKYRNDGIGSYFIKSIEENDDTVAIQLETTPSNKRVFNYYIRLGFEVVKNTHLIKNKK